jgi:abhydrolase domain-containing protein 17
MPGTRITPREHTAFADVEAAYRYLVEERGVDVHTELVCWGRSLGSGPTCHLVSRHPAAALILQSPLQSALRVVFRPQARYTLPLVDMFANIDRAPHITQPTLIMHGTADRVIDVDHSRRLFARLASERKQLWLVDGAGHNDIEFRPEYLVRVRAFLGAIVVVEE